MQWRTLAGVTALAVVVIAAVGVVTNFALDNDLFVSSEMQVAALVSLGFVVAALVVFAGIGKPWRAWSRTPYW